MTRKQKPTKNGASKKSPAYPAALKALFADWRKDKFADVRLPPDLVDTFGDHAPIFDASAELRFGPDPEDVTDVWNALVEADVLERTEVEAHRKRFVPICVTDDVEYEPHFNALVVDVSKPELPVLLVGEKTDCRFVEIAASLDAFRAQLKPPAKKATPQQRDRAYFKKLHATCFDKRDYEAARALAEEDFFDDDRRYEALRIWAYASLQLGDLDEAKDTYETLHDEFGLLPNSPIASARSDLASCAAPLAEEILTWLGVVPVASEDELEARRAWWRLLERPLKKALVEALSGPAPDIDQMSDAHLGAVLALKSLVVAPEKGTPAIDLSPLSRLSALESLTLRGDTVRHDTLASLTGLQRLRIEHPGATTSVAFLAGMRRLEKLSIFDGENITDLSPLADTETLTFLQLNNSPARDLAFLRNKPALALLHLKVADEVTDFSPLAELGALKQLTLYSSTVTTLGFLDPLAQLEELEVRPRRAPRDKLALRDLDGLGHKPHLERLVIADAPELRGISVLRDATALQRLELADCVAVSDFSVLKGCSLTELDLGGCTQVRDLSFLEGSPKLVKLKIEHTSVTDLSPLAACRALETLSCWGMHVRPVLGLERVLELPAIDELSVVDDMFPAATGKLLRKRYRHLLSRD